MKSTKRCSGFSMVEVIIVLAVTVPILLVIGSVSRAALGSFAASERNGATTEVLLKSLADVERALRFGGRESLQTPATANDVRLNRARTAGEWIALPRGEPRTEVRVSSLTGDESPEMQIPRVQYGLKFVPDRGEILDAIDNDRDGMIDEGSLQLIRGTTTRVLIKNLEQCTFELDGQSVNITLRCVRPGHGRTLQRTTLRSTVVLMNP